MSQDNKTPIDLGDLFLAVNSNAKLFQTLKDYDNMLANIKQQEVELLDEIQAHKDTYLELIRMNAEGAEMSRIFQNSIDHIKEYKGRPRRRPVADGE